MCGSDINLWDSAAHALEYLARADSIPHRSEGEAELLAWLPRPTARVLDLGSGDGRLLALVRLARPETTAVALDFSETMHRGTVHDDDQRSRDVCSMRGTCDSPVAALFALLSSQGVLPHSSEALPDLSRSFVSAHADEHPASRLTPPDSPPPRT